MPDDQKACIINYKVGFLNGICLGYAFDKLEPCCRTFNFEFFRTGNTKKNFFSKDSLREDTGSGLNLIVHGNQPKLTLSTIEIYFCPWCGSPITVQRSKSVTLRQRMMEVPNGYEEVAEKTLIKPHRTPP
ncbi:MAG: hypothetical protein A3B99_05175 [Candidatus Yanofskybacteria bacterium RIFCSPHIGHO2_02_FULL_44_12b]|uniref:Uncharacterized protein n=2 Tax=Candidatus Yanofskyibacteriota TaxID=1752733 RepID=A0A1F8GLT3_9BACT|nr:MAG: hypothetical protein UW79_C0023G0029 [Candidatus Yanofskybacteria bacterium GW2011_GWA2_44_9]OGN04272.1 MAG: hypothetical protein A2659_03230 [Candidatus Yanofskybacteria bacterium RIFCSPHIGHO2_01_FULL_44_24]OGN14378.1 MAG: hypothetical protein A3B99_05175 [Candidatus Yanofskybacteria bacterium RIFCSPHIGHO2_02_FULL_44_12b]OGN25379.1 MAG: hypothetical protein A2925_00740 [Candidatus Yanofskybacteria bacterium RIFCSPLOWO2_01_FULL_44_22]